MSSEGRTSPSLASRPSVLTARQRREAALNDDDVRPLNRKSGSGGFLGKLSKPSKTMAIPPRPRISPTLSPSILGAAERTTTMDEEEEAGFLLPPSATSATLSVPAHAQAGSSLAEQPGRASLVMPVPDGPAPSSSNGSLLLDEASIGADEAYGADERALNDFLHVHPMLSMGTLHHHT